jgi:ribosomal protein S18 acetylase RimI-like enzyme
MSAAVTIRRYIDVAPSPRLADQIDAIFFEASNTKTFASDEARAAFRRRWLGRYLTDDPRFAYLALDASEHVAGYLVGAVDDPASSDRFADLGYPSAFRGLTTRFPAHLHVNLAPQFRNRGIGGRLIDTFAADAKQHGAPGVHVVTGVAADNVRFYIRNRFVEAAQDRPLVLLARAL